MDYGIKVTKDGKSITSTTQEDYLFWSKYPIFRTLAFGTTSYTFDADHSSVTLTLTHNQNVRLAAWLSIDGSAQNSQWVTVGHWETWYSSGGNTALRSWTLHSLANTVEMHYIETNVGGSGFNPTGEVWNFKWYMFIEQIA